MTMPETKTDLLPQWAPPVPQHWIRQLYLLDAQGIVDAEWIDKVGFALYSRCDSFLTVNAAASGRVPCPRCGQIVPRAETLVCPCGWQVTWKAYHHTFQHKQLSGVEPVLTLFRDFTTKFPSTQDPRQKMFLIDQLIHGFHYLHQNPTRPVAVNLIEGGLKSVVAFLDSLTYSPISTPGLRENWQTWDQGIRFNSGWYGSRQGFPDRPIRQAGTDPTDLTDPHPK